MAMTPEQRESAIADLVSRYAANAEQVALLRSRLRSTGSELRYLAKSLTDTPRDVAVKDGKIVPDRANATAKVEDVMVGGDSLKTLIEDFGEALREHDLLSEEATASGLGHILRTDF